MSRTIPTVAELQAQVIVDYETELGQSVPLIQRAFVRVWALAVAGALHLTYRFGLWVYRQIFTTTADLDALIERGAEYNIARRGAVTAILLVVLTGDNGTPIPKGTLFQRNGLIYETLADATIASGSATVEMRAADAESGESANVDAGLALTIVAPIAGIDPEGLVASTVRTGEDVEDVETFRSRILLRQRTPPQGGAVPDWIAWTLEVPGVTAALPLRTAPGEIAVYPLVGRTFEDRLPSYEKLEEITAYISDPVRRPLNCETAEARLFSEVVFDVELSNLVPDSVAIRASVIEAVNNYLLERFPKIYDSEVDPRHIVSLTGFYAAAQSAGARSIEIAVANVYGPLFSDYYTLESDELAAAGSVAFVD